MQDHFDIVIVGAGAAGMAAAARLSRAPLSVVVLEARDRIGGRAHTLRVRSDLPLDLGCGWVHSADRNPLVPLLARKGVEFDRSEPPWSKKPLNEGFDADDYMGMLKAQADLDARLADAALQPQDRRAADFLDRRSRFTPLLEAISTYYNGAEYGLVSVQDYDAYEDTGVNWRVADGYGAAIALLTDRALVVPGCAVRLVRHEGTELSVETSRGVITTRAVVVTTPTPTIAGEHLRFFPRLPDKADAATGLPLGLADKVFLRLEEPEAFPREAHAFGRTDRTETGSYHLRPFGRPYVEAFFGGRHARALEQAGEGARVAAAIDELAGLFGERVRRTVKPLVETAWAADPWAMGSYSHALPGCVSARAALAEPVDDRLFFAGEATSRRAYSTAHGAWETGLRAADEVLAALKIQV